MLREITVQTVQENTERIGHILNTPSKSQKRVKFDADGNLPLSSEVLICCPGRGKKQKAHINSPSQIPSKPRIPERLVMLMYSDTGAIGGAEEFVSQEHDSGQVL